MPTRNKPYKPTRSKHRKYPTKSNERATIYIYIILDILYIHIYIYTKGRPESNTIKKTQQAHTKNIAQTPKNGKGREGIHFPLNSTPMDRTLPIKKINCLLNCRPHIP